MAKRPRQLHGAMPARSVRISDEIWERSKTRAAYEGTTVSHVIYTLLEGYSKGLVNMPQVQMKYSQPKTG